MFSNGGDAKKGGKPPAKVKHTESPAKKSIGKKNGVVAPFLRRGRRLAVLMA